MKKIWSALILLLCFSLAGADTDQAFPRPAELEPDVRFWARVYSEVDTQGGLLHDTHNLGVVYEVIRFPDDATHADRRRIVDEARERYQRILRELAASEGTALSDEAARVRDLWPEDVDADTLLTATNRIRFQLGQADRFREGLVRSGTWMDHIYETLDSMDLPRELAVLPHVESSFNPAAYSRVGAAGMWQFTRSTGRRYMQVDHVIDERLDPYKSTVAAARLLKHNKAVTGTWPLALTAYNHGSAGMRRAANEMGTRDIAVIARNYRSRTFGFASRNFYVAFLAALEVQEEAEALFGPLVKASPEDHVVVELPDYIPAKTLANALDVDVSLLREHNRALRPPIWNGQKFVPRGFELRVPRSAVTGDAVARVKGISLAQRYDRQRPDVVHTVQRGESLSTIARRYRVSERELVALNNLSNRHLIRAGQRLRLPASGGDVEPIRVAHRSQDDELPENGVYSVQRGDTLTDIARRFGTDASWIAAANDLDNRNRIYVGQALQVGAPEPREKPTEIRAVGHDLTAKSAEPPARPSDPAPSAQAERPDIPDIAEPIGALDVAIREAAEPTAVDEAEAIGPAQPADGQHELSADPSDYAVADDQTIEVQAAETLGHYADWLDLRTQRLRDVNGMPFGRPVVIGQRVRLDFSQVSKKSFEERRAAHHQGLQEAFFSRFEIVGTRKHGVERGDTLWILAHRERNIPVWLLRQYNPDLDFRSLRPGAAVTIPIVERRSDPSMAEAGAE